MEQLGMSKGTKKVKAPSFNIDSIRTNKDKESDGVWIDAGEGLRLKIARINNPKYNAYLNDLLRPHREALRGFGEIDPEVIETVTIQAMAKCVLLDWENLHETVLNADGTPKLDADGDPVTRAVPYSPAKAEEFMRIGDFLTVISNYARSAANFRDESVKANKGN